MSTTAVYEPLSLDNYELCHPVIQGDFESIHLDINGTSRVESWRPIAMRIIREDEGRRLVESDSPWLGSHALIFRPRAIQVLGPLLRQYGELLPLDCDGAELAMYNPTRVLDALNEEASDVMRFGGGRIMMIKRHVFRQDVIREIDIFKIPSLRVSPTFVSHRFVDLWRSTGLKGLEFKQVWALD